MPEGPLRRSRKPAQGRSVPLTPSPEPVWIVGPVTWDEVVRDRVERVPGGTALYTARASEALGIRAHILTAAGPDADLDAFRGHASHIVAADTLTLRHEFPAGERVQSPLQPTGRTLVPSDVPTDWPEPATLLLAPLLAEDIDVTAFIDDYPTAEVGLLAQGLQRAVLPDQRIAHRAQPSSVLVDAARPNVTIFLSAEETRLWPAGAIEHLAARAARVIVTRGPDGARIVSRTGVREVPPVPADPVDPTGAGDVFAAAFILGLRAGEEFAGRLAAACAAAACEVHGPGVLPSLTEIEDRFHPASNAVSGQVADGGQPA